MKTAVRVRPGRRFLVAIDGKDGVYLPRHGFASTEEEVRVELR